MQSVLTLEEDGGGPQRLCVRGDGTNHLGNSQARRPGRCATGVERYVPDIPRAEERFSCHRLIPGQANCLAIDPYPSPQREAAVAMLAEHPSIYAVRFGPKRIGDPG